MAVDFDARPLSEDEREASGGLQLAGRTGFKGRLFQDSGISRGPSFGTVRLPSVRTARWAIFESNSIMRAVARLGADAFPLYGRDAYSAARIDSFLDASLVFARDSQIYLLRLRGEVPADVHARARDAFSIYMSGIEQALAPAAGTWSVMTSLWRYLLRGEFTLFSQRAGAGQVAGRAWPETHPAGRYRRRLSARHGALRSALRPCRFRARRGPLSRQARGEGGLKPSSRSPSRMRESMARPIEFHFDFMSPYSYLATTQFGALRADTGAEIVYGRSASSN